MEPFPRQGASRQTAVLALTLCVMALIASEFLPVSLLTPIASDLLVSEGRAGQAIAISGVFAVVTSLFISVWTARIDRRDVLLSLTVAMVASGLFVAAAPNYPVLMLGRALLGVAIGGFWAMSTATVMRLVPAARVPAALATLNAGNALAATVAAPLGSFVGSVVGWRGAFFSVVPLATVALVWLFLSIPTLPPRPEASSRNSLELLRRPSVAWGMAAVLLLFMGQFALFTYLRPFLETITHVSVSTLSLILLGIGLAGLVGNTVAAPLWSERLMQVLMVAPAALAAIATVLLVVGGSLWAVAVLMLAWGFVSTPAPVGWGTWLTRTLPDDAEAGGGLMVATIQLAITLGASMGGVAYDALGYRATFALSAALLLAGAAMALKADALFRQSGIRDRQAPLLAPTT